MNTSPATAGAAAAGGADAAKTVEPPKEAKKKMILVESTEGNVTANAVTNGATNVPLKTGPTPTNVVQFFNKTSEGVAVPRYCEINLKPSEFYGLSTKAKKLSDDWWKASGGTPPAPAAGGELPADLPLLDATQFATFYKGLFSPGLMPKASTLQPDEAEKYKDDLALAINFDDQALKTKVGWFSFLIYLCSNGQKPPTSEYKSSKRFSFI